MRRAALEIVVGGALFVALGVALVAASAGGRGAAAGGYELGARFTQVDGLVVGSAVQLAGVKVGAVARIGIDPSALRPLVTLRIRRGVAIPADSAAMILSDGVLGEKFIRIEPGSENRAMAPGASFDTVQDAIVIEQLLEKIVRGAEARRKPAASP
jgi:phospholipid/cholesterol/gamma-HCH transport system substrate-binding protein